MPAQGKDLKPNRKTVETLSKNWNEDGEQDETEEAEQVDEHLEYDDAVYER